MDGEPHIQPPGTITILKSALRATMLAKFKKPKKGEKFEQKIRTIQNEGSNYCSETPHLGIEVLTHGKGTSDELNHNLVHTIQEDDEPDAFL